MESIKEKVIKVIKKLPDNANWDDIQYHIYVREKVERGIKAIDEGKIITQEELERRVADEQNLLDGTGSK